MVELHQIVDDFAATLSEIDSRSPIAVNQRSGRHFLAGIGPFSEAKAVQLIFHELHNRQPRCYSGYELNVPYAHPPRQRCDVCIGVAPQWEWCVEIKLFRLLGDNGKLNDNMLMHILSPYEQHRSAVTDCDKLLKSGLVGRKAIMIYGFSTAAWPIEPAIDAFETLAGANHELGVRHVQYFGGLVHPVHTDGAVFGWELLSGKSAGGTA